MAYLDEMRSNSSRTRSLSFLCCCISLRVTSSILLRLRISLVLLHLTDFISVCVTAVPSIFLLNKSISRCVQITRFIFFQGFSFPLTRVLVRTYFSFQSISRSLNLLPGHFQYLCAAGELLISYFRLYRLQFLCPSLLS